MLTTYEQHLVLSCLTNAVRCLHRDSPESKELFDWVSENSELLPAGCSLVELCEEGARRRKSRGDKSRGGPSKDQWDALRDRLTTGEHGATRRVRADRLASRLRRLGREMQLSRTDVAILEIMLRYRSNPVVEDLLDSVFEEGHRFRRLTRLFNVRGPALPCLLGIRGTTFLARFEPDAPLVKSGLIAVDEDGDVTVIDRLHRLASGSASARDDAHALLLDTAPPRGARVVGLRSRRRGTRPRRGAPSRRASGRGQGGQRPRARGARDGEDGVLPDPCPKTRRDPLHRRGIR